MSSDQPQPPTSPPADAMGALMAHCTRLEKTLAAVLRKVGPVILTADEYDSAPDAENIANVVLAPRPTCPDGATVWLLTSHLVQPNGVIRTPRQDVIDAAADALFDANELWFTFANSKLAQSLGGVTEARKRTARIAADAALKSLGLDTQMKLEN